MSSRCRTRARARDESISRPGQCGAARREAENLHRLVLALAGLYSGIAGHEIRRDAVPPVPSFGERSKDGSAKGRDCGIRGSLAARRWEVGGAAQAGAAEDAEELVGDLLGESARKVGPLCRRQGVDGEVDAVAWREDGELWVAAVWPG